MKFSFKFSNLLGAIYRNGNLVFTPDGYSIISPVGNRLAIFDLKNNKTRTLSLESRYNYTNIALSPDGNVLIAVNECGEAQLISMVSCTVVHRHKFQTRVQCVVYSPNGSYFAVAKENMVFIFHAPGELSGEYNPFVLQRHLIGGYDDITWLDWSFDSRFLAIGCRDNSTKICAVRPMRNFRTYVLAGHSDSIVSCFFEENSMHINTLSRNGQLCLWECSLLPSQLSELKMAEQNMEVKKMKNSNKIDESEDDIENTVEKRNVDSNVAVVDKNDIKDESAIKKHPFFYKKLARYYLGNEPRKESRNAILTAANYNAKTRILVVSFSTGFFYLYELPEVNMIHSLNMSAYAISTAVMNSTGDWVALASRELGQLLVWEWQSEQYIMKQQGHSSEMKSICYSPDGQYIATGGEDGKVKLWNSKSGFCFITFSEHTGGITGVQFSKNKKFLVSSSLDGTVRAFDIIRYRNFRTFTSPRLVQFACVAIDSFGELVVAGGQDVFEIYLWSIKLGQLLEIISGHEGPVSCVAFSPNPNSSTLVSGSWDKTIKIWNCLENNSEHETIDILSDVVSLAYNPNGESIAVATLNGNISIFDIKTMVQLNSIEGRNDLGMGHSDTDIITAKKNLQGKYFSSIEYSVDGKCILAGGNSQMICIYHVEESILLKKLQITQNHSLDGLDEYLNRRHMSEFGNMTLIEQREEHEGGNVPIRLPGVQKGDMATRSHKPEIKVFAVKFSPTGQALAVACTEGLCIYSLDKGVVFDPFNLSLEITPKFIRESLSQREFSKALIMSLKLNEFDLISLVLESIPYSDIELICATLPNEICQRLLTTLAQLLSLSSHIEFYLKWCQSLVSIHGNKESVFEPHSLLALHESISRKYEILNRICDFNKYTMRTLLNVAVKRVSTNDGKPSDATDCESDNELMLIRSVSQESS